MTTENSFVYEVLAVAKMFPDIDPALIENSGEQRFYEAAATLPDAYSVFYRYKFIVDGAGQEHDTLFEADFIIVHPRLGYLVVEVKEGQYQYFNNSWQKQLGRDFVEVEKDPAEQAERAMFSILSRYKKEAQRKNFPLGISFAVCFPDCSYVGCSRARFLLYVFHEEDYKFGDGKDER